MLAHFSRSYRSAFPPYRFFSLLFSSTYETLFPQLPCFHIYTKPPRGVGGPALKLPSRSSNSQTTVLFSCISSLFVPIAKLKSFLFSKIQPLSTKRPGWARSHASFVFESRRANGLFPGGTFRRADVRGVPTFFPKTFRRSDVGTFRRPAISPGRVATTRSARRRGRRPRRRR